MVVTLVNPLSSYQHDTCSDTTSHHDKEITLGDFINPMFFQKLVLALKADHVGATDCETNLPMRSSMESSTSVIEMITANASTNEETMQIVGDIQGQLKRRDELLKACDHTHMIV